MANTYTAAAKLAKPALGDRGWDATVNADLDQLDAVAAIGGLIVTTKEIPSTTLNVRVASGVYQSASGASVTYAGTSSFATTTATTNYLWLTDAGTLTLGSAWPSGDYVPLAIVLSGATTITSITDARVSVRSVGPPYVPVATKTTTYTATVADSVLRLDATGGAFTVTLPAANTVGGKVIRLKKIDSSVNVITVSGSIDGAGSISISTQYQAKTLIADGTSNTWGVY